RLAPANAEKLFALVEQEGVLNTTGVLTGQTPSNVPAVARRALPRPDDLDPYAQPNYPRPQYEPPQYLQPRYGQPHDPRYGSAQGYGPYYAQPQYRQPSMQQQDGRYQTYRYRDPYAEPYQPRYRSLFPFE